METSAAASELRIVQVADLHLGEGLEHHLDNWRKVAAWIGAARPDLVVVNGDMLMSDPDDERDFAFARAEIARLGVPCRYLPGNHDVGDNVLSGKMAKRIDESRRERFKRHFGEDHWTFDAAGWTFVGVNAQLFGSDGQAAEAAQWAFIERSLAGAGRKPVALFIHKPLFLDHPLEPDHEDLSMRQAVLDSGSRTRLLELARTHGVRLVVSGHKHQTRSFSLDGIYYLWSPSTACVNGPPDSLHWGVREVGFLDLRFRAGTFEHRFVGADFLFRHENYVRKFGAS